MLPTTYKPLAPSDFIGKAAHICLAIERMIVLHKASGHPLKILLYGHPGVGKSELAEYAVRALGSSKFSISKLSGPTARLENVEDIAKSLHFSNLFDEWRILWLEEVDEMPHLAQVRILMLLDELPKRTAVIATCNSKMKDLEPRFHSRFQAIEVAGPNDAELGTFLGRQFRVPDNVATQIATLAAGNVRQALADAQTYLMAG